MKNLIEYFKSNVFNVFTAIFLYSILSIIFFLEYRLEVYMLLKKIYPELYKFSFFNYMGISFHFESKIILFFAIILPIIMIITANNLKLKYLITSLLLVIQSSILLAGIDFFKTYETTFQKNFVGEETSTGLTEILISFFKFLSVSFYFKFFIFISLIIVAAIALYKINTRIILNEKNKYFVKWSFAKGVVYIAVPCIFISLIYSAIVFKSHDNYTIISKQFHNIPYKKVHSIFEEITMNPFYNILFQPKEKFGGIIKHDIEEKSGKMGEFSFKFDKTSIASGKKYSRIDLLPVNKKYNIILYFFESTPYSYLKEKINGKEVTPIWNKISKNGIVFENHYANYPLSANAMLSVFTSAYELNSKKLVIQRHSDINLKTTPEILKKKGYRTFLVHTGMLEYAGQKRFLKNRKFDEIKDLRDLKKPPFTKWVGWGLDDRALIEPCVDFAKKDNDKPYFMAVFPVSPHHPYPIPDKNYQVTGEIPGEVSERKKVWFEYLNSLHYSDAVLGEFIDRMEKEGLMENTLLFVFADHGEAFYQHRKNYNHPFYIYEENVHVPFVIYNKELFDQRISYRGISSHVDILPTILDIVGIPSMEDHEGISLIAPHREQFALLHTAWVDDFVGIRDKQWKYICRTKDGYEELYNLYKDPLEKINLANRFKNVTKKYRKVTQKARVYKAEYYKRVLKRKQR